MKDYYPQYLYFYDDVITANIERVDFSRLVMMALGGVYADLDTYPSDKNDPMEYIKKGRIVLGTEPREHTLPLYGRDVVLCNAFMISPRDHAPSKKFWERAMKFVIDNYERHYRPVENTGPMALTKMLEQHPEVFKKADVLITNPCVFFPMVANGKISKECNGLENSFVVHEWKNSWTTGFWKNPLWKNKRYQLYGLFNFDWCTFNFDGF